MMTTRLQLVYNLSWQRIESLGALVCNLSNVSSITLNAQDVFFKKTKY